MNLTTEHYKINFFHQAIFREKFLREFRHHVHNFIPTIKVWVQFRKAKELRSRLNRCPSMTFEMNRGSQIKAHKMKIVNSRVAQHGKLP